MNDNIAKCESYDNRNCAWDYTMDCCKSGKYVPSCEEIDTPGDCKNYDCTWTTNDEGFFHCTSEKNFCFLFETKDSCKANDCLWVGFGTKPCKERSFPSLKDFL